MRKGDAEKFGGKTPSQWVNTYGGNYTDVAYTAGDFTASGSMTWTVQEADLIVFTYILNGKIMTINFGVTSSSIGGTVSNYLYIKIPAGKTVGSRYWLNKILAQDNGSAVDAYVIADVGDTKLRISKDSGANWTLSTNNAIIWGQITFATT